MVRIHRPALHPFIFNGDSFCLDNFCVGIIDMLCVYIFFIKLILSGYICDLYELVPLILDLI